MRKPELHFESTMDFVHVEIREPQFAIRKKNRWHVTEYYIELNQWMKSGSDGTTLFMLEAQLVIRWGQVATKIYKKNGRNAKHWTLVKGELSKYATKVQNALKSQMVDVIKEQAIFMQKALDLPGMLEKSPACPGTDCDMHYDQLAGTVMHLNDKHKWTREQIAVWLQDNHDRGIIDISFPEGRDVDHTPQIRIWGLEDDSW